MHFNKIIVFLIALSFLIPIGSSTIVEKQYEEKSCEVYIDGFLFAIGRVANLTEHKSGYSTPWYTVECVDVYCVLSLKDRPLFQHFTDNELLEVDQTWLFYGGMRIPPFILMWPRLLFPLCYHPLLVCDHPFIRESIKKPGIYLPIYRQPL